LDPGRQRGCDAMGKVLLRQRAHVLDQAPLIFVVLGQFRARRSDLLDRLCLKGGRNSEHRESKDQAESHHVKILKVGCHSGSKTMLCYVAAAEMPAILIVGVPEVRWEVPCFRDLS